MLNRVWLAFFLSSAVAVAVSALQGNWAPLLATQEALFHMARFSAEIALGLVGLMTLWLGVFQIAEDAGVVARLARLLSPLFARLMPEVPKGHPAVGSVCMNLMANMLGLDNAATPLGLKAMAELETLNRKPGVATNAQILFVVLNCSSVTLIPVTIFMYRAQLGAAAPADVFLPILLATACSAIAGIGSVMVAQRIRPDVVVMSWLFGIMAAGSLLVGALLQLQGDVLQVLSSRIAAGVVLAMIIGMLCAAMMSRIDAYESFIKGARNGFDTAVRIIPFLVAMLVAVGVFRASGLLEQLLAVLRWLAGVCSLDTRFVDAMPVAFMKPLSGSGARALMLDTMRTLGVDSFGGRLAAVVQGSTETTFYVLSVYMGSVAITRIRHALWCALIADVAGVSAAVAACYWFYG